MAYNDPSQDSVDIEIQSYSVPSGDAVDFGTTGTFYSKSVSDGVVYSGDVVASTVKPVSDTVQFSGDVVISGIKPVSDSVNFSGDVVSNPVKPVSDTVQFGGDFMLSAVKQLPSESVTYSDTYTGTVSKSLFTDSVLYRESYVDRIVDSFEDGDYTSSPTWTEEYIDNMSVGVYKDSEVSIDAYEGSNVFGMVPQYDSSKDLYEGSATMTTSVTKDYSTKTWRFRFNMPTVKNHVAFQFGESVDVFAWNEVDGPNSVNVQLNNVGEVTIESSAADESTLDSATGTYSASGATWYTVDVTHDVDAGTADVYVDGSLVGSVSTTGVPAEEVGFGTFQSSSTEPPRFNGSLDISEQETYHNGMAWNEDGTKLYAIGAGTDDVFEYNLSNPYDVSTALLNQSFEAGFQAGGPTDVDWNDDGTKMYVVGGDNKAIYEYSVSTPYDISTASYTDSLSVSNEADTPQGMAWNSDGTKLYVIGNISASVHEYSLSTAFDVSTASFVTSKDVSSNTGAQTGLSWNSDGTRLFVADGNNDRIAEYTLSTAYDVSTASYSTAWSILDETNDLLDVVWIDSATRMYIVAFETIYEYNTSNSPVYFDTVTSDFDVVRASKNATLPKNDSVMYSEVLQPLTVTNVSTENVVYSDDVVNNVSLGLFSDGVVYGDDVVNTVSKALFSDSVMYSGDVVNNVVKPVSESETYTDVLQPFSVTKAVSETSSFADDVVSVFSRLFTDSVQYSDDVVNNVTKGVNQETMSYGDTQVNVLSKPPTETVQYGDTLGSFAIGKIFSEQHFHKAVLQPLGIDIQAFSSFETAFIDDGVELSVSKDTFSDGVDYSDSSSFSFTPFVDSESVSYSDAEVTKDVVKDVFVDGSVSSDDASFVVSKALFTDGVSYSDTPVSVNPSLLKTDAVSYSDEQVVKDAVLRKNDAVQYTDVLAKSVSKALFSDGVDYSGDVTFTDVIDPLTETVSYTGDVVNVVTKRAVQESSYSGDIVNTIGKSAFVDAVQVIDDQVFVMSPSLDSETMTYSDVLEPLTVTNVSVESVSYTGDVVRDAALNVVQGASFSDVYNYTLSRSLQDGVVFAGEAVKNPVLFKEDTSVYEADSRLVFASLFVDGLEYMDDVTLSVLKPLTDQVEFNDDMVELFRSGDTVFDVEFEFDRDLDVFVDAEVDTQ